MPYLTPESVPAFITSRTLFIPDSPQWLALVSGALLELCNRANWEQSATGITPEAAASAAVDLFMSLSESTGEPMIAAKARKTTATSIANETEQVIVFNQADYDTGALWNAGMAGRLTIPETGLYLVALALVWQDDPSGGNERRAFVREQSTGRVVLDSRIERDFRAVHVAADAVLLLAGEYLQLRVFQGSGIALNALAQENSQTLAVARIG